tara:strand:- start:1 stop:999 length:999 start_codon:yes stop_codon:yes gene_type:complete
LAKYAFTKQFDYNSPKGVIGKVRNISWGINLVLKHGIPTKAFHFGGGLGDHLLCTAVFHELGKRGIQKCWMLSHYPEIFQNSTYGLQVVPDDWKTIKLLEKIKRPSTLLYYGKWFGDNDKIDPPEKHIIAEILHKCDIKGEVCLRPYWYGDNQHIAHVTDSEYICVQSTKTFSSTPMLNKQWDEDSLINGINLLRDRYEVVQLGTREEPKLPNTIDQRNIGIADSASLLTNATFFIGQVGFLMHLARAVDTRSVIIYGGREKAWQSGYPCNENIETSPNCSPCWQNNQCDYERLCMSGISTEDLISGVNRLEARLTQKLEIDLANLGDYSEN